jgi:hypothetical protein
MRMILLILVIIVAGCKNSESKSESIKTDTLENTPDVNQITNRTNREPVISISKTYSNKRFKDVSVEQLDENKFRVRGQGQIFEANFGWIVEDGHEELYKGYQMTDAGAPEWGDFEFTIDATKKRENSTLTLILFESSAKDGSRQYELPIALEL